MKIEPMQRIPSSRAELERNLFILGETLRAGKLHIARGLSHSIDGLRRLRKLPNARVDLLSLDEMTRLNANMMANMSQFSPADVSTPEHGTSPKSSSNDK